jgi:sulfite exporter TauE/SafE
MNCYYHPNQPAVGICKHCQRGLCTDCLVEVDDSLACKDRHEEQVRNLDLLTARNLLQTGRVGSAYLRNAIFYFLVGILFAGFGLLQVRWLGLQGIFLLAIGLFLLYAALTNYLESRKFK